jgi:tetraacyldisaccharide 4'-kinase
MLPRAWVNAATGESYAPDQPPVRRAGAFCGLGSPQSFRRTLAQMGIEPAGWQEFEDHHHYRVRELKRLHYGFTQAGADAMVTTEKDAVNLPEMHEALPIYFLRIAMQIEHEEVVA